MKTFFLAVCLVPACLGAQPHPSEFPDIAGWSAAGEVKTCGPDGLWEYIDGAADQFLAYGFRSLRYRDLASGYVKVTVNIYDMGTPIDAFGIFRTESAGSPGKQAIGAEAAVLPPYQCLLLKGSYYVKAEVFEGTITEASGKALLAAVAKALPGSDGLPKDLDALPAKGKIAGSERFTRKSHLGLSELSHCVHARYKAASGKEYEAFVMLSGAGDSKESIWKRLSGKWSKPEPAESEEKGIFILLKSIPHGGTVGIIRTRKGILGVSGLEKESDVIEILKSF
jgi:hypothetical protein